LVETFERRVADLLGKEAAVAAARVWRRRHGGTLSNLFPFAAAAQRGLDELNVGEPALDVSPQEAAELFSMLTAS
jgi:hypothetical protein